MSLSNGVIMVWLCASTCFALKTFEHKQTPVEKVESCSICTPGTFFQPDVVYSHNGHTFPCQEAERRANHPGTLHNKQPLTCVQARQRWASTCCKQAPPPPTKGCDCLNWKTTYDSAWVECGDGAEFTGGTTKNNDDGLCHVPSYMKSTPFYPGQNHSYCVRQMKTFAETKTPVANWCYVSAGCTQLNGGMKVNDAVSWKQCGANDVALADLSPLDVIVIASKDNIDIQDQVIMSFPWHGPSIRANETEVTEFLFQPETDKNGTLVDVTLTGLKDPAKAEVGKSREFDTLLVRWKEEIWTVKENPPQCVGGPCANYSIYDMWGLNGTEEQLKEKAEREEAAAKAAEQGNLTKEDP